MSEANAGDLQMTTPEPQLAEQKYRTIVADPPWHYARTSPPNPRCAKCGRIRYGFDSGRCQCDEPEQSGGVVPLPYSTMTVEEIAALEVGEWVHPEGCHLYLWTTNRYLRAAYDICEAWGFRPGGVLVWAKPPKGLMGGGFVNCNEYVLTARAGAARNISTHMGATFHWPRGAHSAKPEAFMDLVEQVSPGPYLEMFSRRARLGWDTWGNESLHGGEAVANG